MKCIDVIENDKNVFKDCKTTCIGWFLRSKCGAEHGSCRSCKGDKCKEGSIQYAIERKDNVRKFYER